MSATHKKIYLSMALIALSLLALLAFAPGSAFFASTSFCKHCGARKIDRRDFWLERSTVNPTLLSLKAEELKLVDESHMHEWLFAHGSGGGITCAIGLGRHLFGAIDNPYLIQCLSRTYKEISPEIAKGIFLDALDPLKSRRVSAYLGSIEIEDHPDEKSFQLWLADQEKFIYEYYSPRFKTKNRVMETKDARR